MKLNIKTIIKITISFIFMLCINTISYADIVKLIDGTVIQGKVVRDDDVIYFFANIDGTFEIRKVHVEKLYVTNSYREDLQLSKMHNLKIDRQKAKANYTAGERKAMLMQKKSRKKKKYYEYWDYGRLSISASYFATISEDLTDNTSVNKVLTSGFSGQLAYEQGLDMILDLKKNKKKNKGENYRSKKKYRKTKPRPMGMPGLRIEWNYMYFTKDVFVNDDKEVSGSMYTVGPMWYFPSPHNVWGCFMLTIMPGYSFLKINNREAGLVENNYSFALTTIFGYEYAIKERVALLFHARYTYIADNQISFHGIGASFGISVRLW